MNVCRRREKEADISPEQKWDFISLNDFKCTSCFTGTAYGYLFVSLIISIAVYGVDTFTAINLLVFDRWSGKIQPVIPFDVMKWIFSACIIASWVNLAFEYLRAIHVMRRGAVAESYLDSLAVRLQCIRMGKTGRGFRRFLVFAELTKSKKGVEYVALFTYFSFQSWVRVVLCQGPRQVVNALTLYSVFRAQLEPTESKDVGDAFVRFFKNVGALADSEHQQAVIISGMFFTLVIWVFAALSLILAAIFYIVFLWHHVPTADGSLANYCERKINQRLKRIVSAKVNKALAADERLRRKQEEKALRKGEKPVLGRQATLPVLFDAKYGDKLPNMPELDRQNTNTTLPAYTSRSASPTGQPTLPAFEMDHLDQKRPYGGRTVTGSSTMSNAPLLGNASEMGYGRSNSPSPSLRSANEPPASFRSMSTGTGGRVSPHGQPWVPTASNGRMHNPGPMPHGPGQKGMPRGPPRQNTGMSTGPAPHWDPVQRSNTPTGPPPPRGPPQAMRPPFRGPSQRSDSPHGLASSLDPSQPMRPRLPIGPLSTEGPSTRRSPHDQHNPSPFASSQPQQGHIPVYNRDISASPAPLRSIEPSYQAYNPSMTTTASATPAPPYPLTDPPRPPPVSISATTTISSSSNSSQQPSPRENPGFPFPDMSRESGASIQPPRLE